MKLKLFAATIGLSSVLLASYTESFALGKCIFTYTSAPTRGGASAMISFTKEVEASDEKTCQAQCQAHLKAYNQGAFGGSYFMLIDSYVVPKS